MAVNAIGPTLAGGRQPIVANGYELLYYPDANNHELQRNGSAPVFYWLPNYIHLARKEGRDDGDLMFNLIRFAGVQSSNANVGVSEEEGQREVAGGVLGFTVNSAPPNHVLEESQRKIIEQFEGSNDFFWGIRNNVTPIFRPVIITHNQTSITNLSPNEDGSVVEPVTPVTDEPVPPGTRSTQPLDYVKRPVPSFISKKGFSSRNYGKNKAAKNLQPWFWKMQGEGIGSIDPMGQNAFTALVGTYPTSILWSAFHGSYTPVNVAMNVKMPFWIPAFEITIRGNWERIFEHFSAHAKGRYLWFSADVKAEINNMRMDGTIDVDVKINNAMIPNPEEITRQVVERTDFIVEKFMEQAQTVIFDPPQPDVEAAESSGGGLSGLWGGGMSLKYRRDSTNLSLYYHETRQVSYLQEHLISSSLEGMAEEIERNPEKEPLYFQTLYLDDWPRKLARVVKPVCNWPKLGEKWVGEPVSHMSVQIGYPNTRGEIMWTGTIPPFLGSDAPDRTWECAVTQKLEEHVENPPVDWKAGLTYVKRKVSMLEPPDPFEFPNNRVQIEDNEIELDPGENGTLTNDIILEVRADDASRIRLGPINMNVFLENAKQFVEVTFQATDENGDDIVDDDGNVRFDPVTFRFDFDTQTEGKYWSVFTSDKTVHAYYKYQVKVFVLGGLFTKGMEWTGPWNRGAASGPLIISVPTPEDEGVVVKRTVEIPERLAHDEDFTPPQTNQPPSTKSVKKSGVIVEANGMFSVGAKKNKPMERVLSMQPPSVN
ncbi:hypothetical protein [uncultured Tenacibaculum sp.]|uniref:hypothetical protein n=1 Tax=uncultured Tenacibaculum sp. TaxID=174713 RepID=UPI002606FF34|nr:hypothetical protein [uncultured Tenacibaculum sp.]